MGIFSNIFYYFLGYQSTDKQLECKLKKLNSLKTSIGSSKNYRKKIFILSTFVCLASLCLLIYYLYQSGFNLKKMDYKYFSTSIIIFFCSLIFNKGYGVFNNYSVKNKTTQLKALEIETKLLVKKAEEDVSYKKLTDLLRKYDPNNSLLEDNIEQKSTTLSEKAAKKSPRTSLSPTPYPTFANRSLTDKIVDKLIGDNPHDRYALICSSCHVHNGLMPPNNMARFVYKCYKCQESNTIDQFQSALENSESKLELKPKIKEDSLQKEDPETHKT